MTDLHPQTPTGATPATGHALAGEQVDADAYRAEVDRLTRQRDEAREERDALRKAITARPGDIVILTVDRPLTDREGHEIHERATAAMPGVHVAIIPGGIEASTWKPADAELTRWIRVHEPEFRKWLAGQDRIHGGSVTLGGH